MQSDLLRFQDVEHPGAIPKTCLGHDGNLGTWRKHPYQLWTHHVGLWHTIAFRWSNFPQKERQQPLKPIQNAENSLAKKTIDRSAQTLPFRETGQLQIGPFCRANIERIMPQPVLTALCPLFVPQQHQTAALCRTARLDACKPGKRTLGVLCMQLSPGPACSISCNALFQASPHRGSIKATCHNCLHR